MSFSFLAWLKGLSLFGKVAGGLGSIGGLASLAFLGPVAPFVLAVFKAIGTVIKWFFEAVELTVTHPVILTIVVSAGFYGWHLRGQFDSHKLEAAKIETQNIVSRIKGQSDVEKSKAEAAIAARDAAETEAKKIAAEAQAKIFPLLEANASVASDHPVKAAAPTIALDPGPTAAELRNSKRVRHSSKCAALFCF